MAGAFADAAVGDDIITWLETRFLFVNAAKFICRLEGGVIVDRHFPRNAGCAWNMASTEDALLGVFRHVGEFTAEFSRRADIDQWLSILAVGEGLIKEGPDFGIQTLWDRGVGALGKMRNSPGEVPALGDPFFAPAIHDLDLGMAEKAKGPQGIAGPPVRFVAVENNSGEV